MRTIECISSNQKLIYIAQADPIAVECIPSPKHANSASKLWCWQTNPRRFRQRGAEAFGKRLTFAQVGVDAHVSRRARQALVLPVRDVFFGLGVDVFFGQPEVDNVDGVLPLAARPPHQEVLGLDVTVDQALVVDVLHPRYLGYEGGEEKRGRERGRQEEIHRG